MPGTAESFRIIGSSNDQNREFSDIFGKLGCFHRTSLFTSLTGVFREAIKTSVKALKKMSSLEGVPHRLLCFAGKKRKSELTFLLTSTIYM